MSAQVSEGSAYALIVQQKGRPQQILARFISLLLNYQYGFPVRMTDSINAGASMLLQDKGRSCCLFVIQNQALLSRTGIAALSRNDQIPLFLVVPETHLGQYTAPCEGFKQVHLCPWERAFRPGQEGLRALLRKTLSAKNLHEACQAVDEEAYEIVQQQVVHRLKNLHTLPTLPGLVLRILHLVNDPEAKTQDLEKLLCQDPAGVLKLLQVANCPLFAPTTRRNEKLTLTEIIVRLGLKKVGAIALQIKMINSLVRPEESRFELRRFWEHAVGTAMLADQLYTRRLLSLPSPIEFDDYWIGSLLHDIGKLVLGFFFWDCFSRTLEQARQTSTTFREAERQLGDMASHEWIGQLLMLRADMGPALTDVVGRHHIFETSPTPLVCLVHMANNLCKDLGLGYMPDERGDYREEVLHALQVTPEKVQELKTSLDRDVAIAIQGLVNQCL